MRRLNACGDIVPSHPRASRDVPTSNYDKRNVHVDHVLPQIDAISAHPELPVDLLDHLRGRAACVHLLALLSLRQ